jgi:hypothetical protein
MSIFRTVISCSWQERKRRQSQPAREGPNIYNIQATTVSLNKSDGRLDVKASVVFFWVA